MKSRELLARICAQPTAPFREGWVAREIKRILDENQIPYFHDRGGNLFAGAKSSAELARGFRIGMIAHMDHPGFHVGRPLRDPSGRLFEATFWGGAPFDGMLGSRVRVYSPRDRGRELGGRIREVFGPKPKAEGRKLILELDLENKDKLPTHAYGSFDFAGIEFDGDRVLTRAADDLAGCAIALGALVDQWKTRVRSRGTKGAAKKTAPLFAVFTRAEEVGFIGCIDLLEHRCLKPNAWMISLEASRELPDAEFGRGPVLRIGDKACLFDAEFAAVTWQIAIDLQEKTKSEADPFRFQRRLMSGGTCEATPLTLFGFTTAALAVPLRNYHNMGDDGRPAPEIISLSDVEGARRFLGEIARAIPRKPTWRAGKIKEIRRDYRLLKRQLQVKVEAHV